MVLPFHVKIKKKKNIYLLFEESIALRQSSMFSLKNIEERCDCENHYKCYM